MLLGNKKLTLSIQLSTLLRLQTCSGNHYATLGLDTGCTREQIRAAYRILAKQFHPDINSGAEAKLRTQEINAAYEVLRDSERRRAYDDERAAAKRSAKPTSSSKVERNVCQDVHLRLEEFFRGTRIEIRINDPASSTGPETYELTIPPSTAPGTRFRVERSGHFEGGFVTVRVQMKPDFRFKMRGSDLRCDLRISSQRAAQGGCERVRGPIGQINVSIPRGVGRNEIIRIIGEGLPKPRGGRGDLLVRIIYRLEVRVARSSSR